MKLKLMLTTLVAILCVVTIVFLNQMPEGVNSSSKKESYSPENSKDQSTESKQAQNVEEIDFSFIEHSDDIYFGNKDAEIKIIEYASFSCIHCGNFHKEVFPKIKSEYIDTGKATLIYRHLPLNLLATATATITNCYDGDKTNVINAVYDNQNEFIQISEQGMLNQITDFLSKNNIEISDDVKECSKSSFTQEKMLQFMEESIKKYQITATPTLVIGETKLTGVDSFEEVKKTIENEF
jgi:protein-disulfide isomerase